MTMHYRHGIKTSRQTKVGQGLIRKMHDKAYIAMKNIPYDVIQKGKKLSNIRFLNNLKIIFLCFKNKFKCSKTL